MSRTPEEWVDAIVDLVHSTTRHITHTRHNAKFIVAEIQRAAYLHAAEVAATHQARYAKQAETEHDEVRWHAISCEETAGLIAEELRALAGKGPEDPERKGGGDGE